LDPVEADNPYRPDPQKMAKWWMETQGSIQAKIMSKQREKAEKLKKIGITKRKNK